MRRWLVLGVLALAAGAPAARAVPLGGTVLVDRPSGFGPLPFDGIGRSDTSPHGLTPDGRFAVFESASNSLLSGDEDTALNVYRVEVTTGALVQVDTTATGGQPTVGSVNDRPSISADGDHVGFTTTSSALAPGATPDDPQFVVKNLTTGAVELASRSSGANGAAVADLSSAVLSGDGRHVVFTAQSAVQTATAATGLTTTTDAYVRDLNANTTRMASVTDPGGAEGGGVTDVPDIDFSGDAVAFVTTAALVPAADTDTNNDAYARTGIGGATEHTVLVSFSAGQTLGADGASAVALANGPAAGQLQLAWEAFGRIWWAPCVNVTTCNTAATQADHSRSGGTDDEDNRSPFFPPQQSAANLPTRVYWGTRDPLDPADTNTQFDLYGWDIGGVDPNTAIHLMTGGDAIDGAVGTAATNDGAITAFNSDSTNLPGSGGLVDQAYVRRAATDTNISQPVGQQPRTDSAGDAFLSGVHATSDDGRFVAFDSDATAFGNPIGPNGPTDQVVVRDVVTGRTQLASAVGGGQTPGNDSSFGASMDAAGDRVVFDSMATNLVPGDTNQTRDVFMRDLATGTTTLIDRTAGNGVPSDGAANPGISADGTKVVYLSNSRDIPGAAPDGKTHVYEYDVKTADVTLIDKSTGGSAANDNADQADVDADGRRVAFMSRASNLGGSSAGSVYVRDLTNPATPTTTWVSVPQDGSPAHDQADDPSIDGDGGRIAFTERGPSFGFAITGSEQVFIRTIATATTTLVSTGPSGTATTFASGPSVSADGSRVSFFSNAPNLPGASPGFDEVYVRDLTAGTTLLAATRAGAGTGGRFGADGGALSGNGACLAFESSSDDLVAGGYGSDFEHVFLHALSSACASPVSGPPPPPPKDTAPPVISRLSLTHRRFAVGPVSTALTAARHPSGNRPKKKVVKGTTFTFTLSEDAITRIAITERRKGHRASSKKPCNAARRRQRRNCTRTVTLLTLVRKHTRTGADRIAFSGRYAGKRLARGSYAATLTATDAAGNRSKPRRLTFTVIG